jgi:hypothetical protein
MLNTRTPEQQTTSGLRLRDTYLSIVITDTVNISSLLQPTMSSISHPDPALPAPAHIQADSMLSRRFGRETVNYFGGTT